MILTADWHLTDAPDEEYRWDVFRELQTFCAQQNDKEICILGDITDRKDRHSGALVNKLVAFFTNLGRLGYTIRIIMGNHDRLANGEAYWLFLGNIKGVHFIERPAVIQGKFYLPYTPSPVADWTGIFDGAKAPICFIHQPVAGARLSNGTILDGNEALPLPKDAVVWGGDIHPPQIIGQVHYVGSPHPIKFGDYYNTRFVRIDAQGCMIAEHYLDGVLRWLIQLRDVSELRDFNIRPNDQVKLRVLVSTDGISRWAENKQTLEDACAQAKVKLMGIEAIVQLEPNTGKQIQLTYDLSPADILTGFAQEEGLDDKTLQWAINLLGERT